MAKERADKGLFVKGLKCLATFAVSMLTMLAVSCNIIGGTVESVLDSTRSESSYRDSKESSSFKESSSSSEYNSSSSEYDSSSGSDSAGDSGSSGDTGDMEDERPAVDDVYRMKADDKYVAIDVQNAISAKTGQMSFITKESYHGIKRIAFNVKTGIEVSWWGIAITDDTETASLYNTDLTVGRVATNDYWVTYVFDFCDTGCTIYSTQGGYNPRELKELSKVPYAENGAYYIYFVGPLWETFSQPICVDNFTVELFDGTTYVDTFDKGADLGLFYADNAVTHVIGDSTTQGFPDEEETPMYETSDVFYQSNDRIDFTAYAPVTVENWAGSGTSNPNLVTDTQYRYMAEAGFTKSLALYEGRTGDSGYTSNEKAEIDALSALAVAEKYGIKYYVLNEKFYNFVRPDINLEFFDLTNKNGKLYNTSGQEVTNFDAYKYLKSNWVQLYKSKLSAMFSEDTRYIDSPAYGGNFASDEPALPIFENGEWYYGELEQLYYQLLLYDGYMQMNSKYGGEAYVNLNPYGSVNPAVRERYDAMLDYYFKNIAPLLGYVSYDQYPLNYLGTAYINATHLLNLEIMANYCKAYDVELRSFIWSKTIATGHRAMIGANDLRFQAYANLAFGVKEMPYYTYFNYYKPGTDACDSLIDCQTGARTSAYYWAKEVNNEIHSFEKAYLNFKWEGSMYLDAGMVTQQFTLLETSMTTHERLKNIRSNKDVVVGVFSDKDGAHGRTDGFMVMNYSDPYYANKGEKDNVVLTFENATHALVYKNGKQYIAELTDGKLSAYLEAGEGIFVVPYIG